MKAGLERGLLVIATVALLVAPAAAYHTHFGEDLPPPDPRIPHPNADAAQASFLAELVGVGIHDFESFPDGQLAPIICDFGGGETAVITGDGEIENVYSVGRFPISGSKYWEVTGSFELDFANPQASFGFYGTDIGDFIGQITLTLHKVGGGTQLLTVPNIVDGPNGSCLYYGLVADDPNEAFTKITFGNTAAGADFFGYDDFTIGNLQQTFTPALTTTPPNGGTLAFGNVRIGTTKNASLIAANTGEAQSELNGTSPAAAGPFGPATALAFGPLAQGASTSRPYTYAPAGHGADALPVTVTSNGGDSTITLAGTGVGPVYDSTQAPGGTYDFGAVLAGHAVQQPLTVQNLTPDPDLGSLTDLTLLTANFSGPDAGLFSLLGFTPGMVLSKDELAGLAIEFAASGPTGTRDAVLTLVTDQSAAFGAPGDQFRYILNGRVRRPTDGVIPEPACVALGGVVLLALRRRRA